MEYNWKEIFKNKTDRELYDIYLGRTSLNSEQREFAGIELENRNFNFENLDRQRKKWELEHLIEEEKSYSMALFSRTRSWEYLILGFGGLVIAVTTLFLIIANYLAEYKPITALTATFFAFVVGSILTVIGFLQYKSKRSKEKFREKRLKELIKEL
jgi:hypothetical protein